MADRTARQLRYTLALATAALLVATSAPAQEFVRIAGAPCATPPPLHCPEGTCTGARDPGSAQSLTLADGPLVDAETGLHFFLDYPCDLRPGEPVTFVLSLHGAGAPGNWHRHYFPLVDFKDEHRLVIATPYSPERRWSEEYDAYLRNVTNFVVDGIGARNIRSFWLAGHSQGGITSRRIVCTDFFRDRVDGVLSLSGGRIGGTAPVTLLRPGATPRPAGSGGGLSSTPPAPECDFSHIYTTGEHELTDRLASLPAESQLADRFSCDARARRADVVDTEGGYLGSGGPDATLSWGRAAGPGTSMVWEYPGCSDGRIVADVVRMDKGHTEGLEPDVTEAIIRLMLRADGGKLQTLN